MRRVTSRLSILSTAALAIAALASGSPAAALAGTAQSGHVRAHAQRHSAHHRHVATRHRGASACRRHGRHVHRAGASRGCVASLRRSSTHAQRKHRHSAAPPAASPVAQDATARAESIARALATPCENTQLTPEPSNLEVARASVLCLINRDRAQAGETPLNPDPRLQAAAQSHVDELIAQDYFAHVSPSGVTPVDRVRSDGYIPGPEFGYLIGENLAWGTLSLSTPQAIVEAWMNSPEHRANILEANYADTGIALAPSVPASLSDGQPGATYAQEFGAIIS
jgi:uncharacterized protein YkwD